MLHFRLAILRSCIHLLDLKIMVSKIYSMELEPLLYSPLHAEYSVGHPPAWCCLLIMTELNTPFSTIVHNHKITNCQFCLTKTWIKLHISTGSDRNPGSRLIILKNLKLVGPTNWTRSSLILSGIVGKIGFPWDAPVLIDLVSGPLEKIFIAILAFVYMLLIRFRSCHGAVAGTVAVIHLGRYTLYTIHT